MKVARSVIYAGIIPLLSELVEDWELEDWDDAVSEQTRLISDLGLTSVDFIDLFVAIEKDLGRSIGFHDLLMVDGQYISDLSLGQLTDFLEAKLNSTGMDAHESMGREKASTAIGAKLDADTIERFRNIIPQPEARSSPSRKNKRAVFLLSASRSGSTLLQVIMAGHPSLFAPPELHLLWFTDLKQRRLVLSQDGNKHLVSGTIRAMMELDGLTVEQAKAFMQQCEDQRIPVSEFYSLLQQRLGKRLLVDKTPSNAYSLEVLRRAEQDFDESLYLQLVRHPCGMARSFADAKLERIVPFMLRHESEFTRQQFAELAWLTCNQNITDFLQWIPPARQHRIHYEDLVTLPSPTLEGICRFLGLEFHPEMLDPYQDKNQRMADGVGTVSQMSGDLKFHLHHRIEPEAAYRWRQFMSEDEMSDTTWDLAEKLGYRKGT